MRLFRVNVLVGALCILGGLALSFGMAIALLPDTLHQTHGLVELLFVAIFMLLFLFIPGGILAGMGWRLCQREHAFEWRWILGTCITIAVSTLTVLSIPFGEALSSGVGTEVVEVTMMLIYALAGLCLYLRLCRAVLRWRGFGHFTHAELMPRWIVACIAVLLWSHLSTLAQEALLALGNGGTTTDTTLSISFTGIITVVLPIFLAWSFYKIIVGLAASPINPNQRQPRNIPLEPSF